MTDYDEGGEYDGTQDEPKYLLPAREAEMLLTGGFNLQKDPQRSGDLYTEAAEAAMEAMKGRLANQYYQKAEEAWACMEEKYFWACKKKDKGSLKHCSNACLH
eukprot:XP_012826131.1 PREDICTED: eukaryotic elongation factor 2 kinase-like [Xenopus tropicalis]